MSEAIARLYAEIEKGRRRLARINEAHAPKPPTPIADRDQKWKAAKKLISATGLKGLKVRGLNEDGTPRLKPIKHRSLGTIQYRSGNKKAGLAHMADKHSAEDKPDTRKLPRMKIKRRMQRGFQLHGRGQEAAVLNNVDGARAPLWLATAYKLPRKKK